MKPIRVYPYEPKDQTPKFVTIKKTQAPKSAPQILLSKVKVKNLDKRPIKRTLPQVKKVINQTIN